MTTEIAAQDRPARIKAAAMALNLRTVADDLDDIARNRDMHEGLREELRKVAAFARLCAK